MVAYPQDLGGGEARQHRIPGELQHLLSTDPLGDGCALVGSTLIVPHNARAEYIAVCVEQHQAVHLPGEAHAGHLASLHTTLVQHPSNAGDGGSPPVGRILFGP